MGNLVWCLCACCCCCCLGMSFALSSKLFKVVVIGDASVGKTCLLGTLTTGKFMKDTKATLGVDLCDHAFSVDGEDVTLQLWDTAGQERVAGLTVPSLQGLERWRNAFIEGAFVTDPTSVPMVVFGNKIDEDRELWEVSKAEMEAWCAKYGLPLFLTSAKDNVGLLSGFEAVAQACMQSDTLDDDANNDTIEIQALQPNKPKKDGCSC